MAARRPDHAARSSPDQRAPRAPYESPDAPLHPSRHLVLRVRLPDRPGALGAVASRIGAVGADITDVTVARRGGGSAVDVFHLTLPPARVDVLALLVAELGEVDGAKVEGWGAAGCCGHGA